MADGWWIAHHVLQLVEVEVRGPKGHHQVPESDQGGVLVGKQTNLEWTSWLSVSCVLLSTTNLPNSKQNK